MPKIMTNNPTRTTRRGFAVGRSFGIPMAANTSAADNGRMRTPVSMGTELQNYGQEQRDRKEHARLDQKLREEHGKSATELAVSQHRRIKQRLLPRSGQASLPAQESVHDQEPGDQQPHHRGKPDQLRSVGFGLHPTPLARAQYAEDDHAQPDHGQDRSDVIEARLRRWDVDHLAQHQQDQGQRSRLRRRTRNAMTQMSSRRRRSAARPPRPSRRRQRPDRRQPGASAPESWWRRARRSRA